MPQWEFQRKEAYRHVGQTHCGTASRGVFGTFLIERAADAPLKRLPEQLTAGARRAIIFYTTESLIKSGGGNRPCDARQPAISKVPNPAVSTER